MLALEKKVNLCDDMNEKTVDEAPAHFTTHILQHYLIEDVVPFLGCSYFDELTDTLSGLLQHQLSVIGSSGLL